MVLETKKIATIRIICKNIFAIAAVVFAMTYISGCKHDLEDEYFVGPELIAAPSDFVITDSFILAIKPVDFALQKEYCLANFSHRVSWEINIVGTSSGAVKKLRGISQSLDITNTEWDGNSDNINFFKNNEECIATLSFFGSTYNAADTFVIFSTKIFDGLLISNFEGGGIISGWSYSQKPGELISFNSSYDSINTVQGNKCLHIKGEDIAPDGYLGISYNNGDLTPGLLSADPATVYFNCFVNGVPNTKLEMRMVEYDGDEYSYFVDIGWNGWKQISVSYDYFALTAGSGVNGKNPNNLQDIKFALRSNPSGNLVEVNIDFIIFTENTPFKQ